MSVSSTFRLFFSKLLFIFPLLFTLYLEAQPCKEVIGYYPGWQWYDRNKLVNPATIKYDKYTILNYAFFKPNPDGTLIGGDAWADENILKGQINWSTTPTSYYPNTSLVDLAHNNNVKVLISVGGWTWSDNFPQIAASPTKRAKFASECKRLINFYNLDGIDIDWEYPGYATHMGTAADKQNFTVFLQTVRDTLNVLGVQKNKNFLLTACVGASQSNMSNVEWANIVPILDCINLMSYDFFGTWDLITNHNAPLSTPVQGDPTFNVTAAVNYLLNNYNVPPNKLTAGVAFYGRSAKTTSTAGLHVPQTGTTDNITFALDDGSPTYFNILDKQSLFTAKYDAAAQVPYMTGNGSLNTFLSYDDPNSITSKANFIKSKNLRGAIIWEITGDYIETAPGSGQILNTPLADALKTAFCSNVMPCNLPSNLLATSTNNSATLTWATNGGTTSELQYKLSSASAWTTASSTIANGTYTLPNLTSCTSYDSRVKNTCGSLSSSYTNAVTFTTLGCTQVCNAPTSIVATPSNTSAAISWTAVSGATTYNVQYKLANATTWSANNSTTTPTFSIPNLVTCTDYQVQVQTVCATGLSAFSTTTSFKTLGCSTGGGTGTTSSCTSPNSFFFNNSTYIPLGEIKIGQGRLHPIWGVSVDAFIPNNRLEWAISMAHAAHLFRNVTNTAAIPANFYFATAAKESFCGCDQNISAAPTGSSFPFTFQAASTGDGCFQIENLSAYSEMVNMYPQRFPVGQHPNLIGGANFCTAALGKAYYDIFTVKYWEIHKGWNPIGFFNQSTDPNSAIKLMAVAYNRGLWYPALQTVLKDERPAAITSATISPYFVGNSYGYDYQNALTTYTRVLENQANTLPASASAINPQTNQPYNYFDSFYNPQVAWSDINNYINKILPMYPTVNATTFKNTVQTTFNTINAGNAISFRFQLGQVLNTILLNLPADDPSANIATTYGCFQPTGNTNQPPVVTLTSPTNNATFTAPATITLSATASDVDGTIAKVEFYQGTTLLATSTVAPYTFTWTNVAIGTYVITAKAYDDKNAVTTSLSSTCVVNGAVNQPPVVSMTSPANNSVFISPASITLNATASDPDGTISKVVFYKGNTILFTDNTAPYSYVWTNVATGIYSVKARAYDNLGANTYSTAIQINVVSPTISTAKPVVSLTSPMNNATFTAPAAVNLTATASINLGAITKVEFYQGTTILATDNAAPFAFSWQNVAVGNYSITAKAYANNGQSTVSNIANINVVAPVNQAPTCILSSNTTSGTAPANVIFTANANDVDGTISKVELYQNQTLVATLTTAPYVFQINNLAVGTYTFQAKAFDNNNASTNSNTINVVIQAVAVNQAPICSITQPAQNQSFTAAANITINATAIDNDGTIAKVDFYNGSTLLFSDNSSPYGYTWQNVAAGTYNLTVKATDNQGATTTSASVTIVVNPATTGTPPCSQYTAYVENTAYVNGSVVTNNGGVFSCLVAGWCSGAAWAYSPGLGTAWQSAWSQTGTCSQGLPSCSTTPAYVANSTYQTGSVVKNNNNLYQCVIPSWCGSSPLAYEPGVGNAWQQAWNLMGVCPSNQPKVVVVHHGKNNAYLYPNPTDGQVTFVAKDLPNGQVKITLTDLLGKIVLEKNVWSENHYLESTLELYFLPSGIYHLSAQIEDWKMLMPVVKE